MQKGNSSWDCQPNSKIKPYQLYSLRNGADLPALLVCLCARASTLHAQNAQEVETFGPHTKLKPTSPPHSNQPSSIPRTNYRPSVSFSPPKPSKHFTVPVDCC